MEGEYTIDDHDIPYQKKIDLWETGFGLQAVDGLEPSDYMVSLAKENIAGKLTYEQVDTAIKHYHEHEDATTKEADIVSLRITELLSRKGFVFSPATLKSIHKTLFFDVFSDSRIKIGDYRKYNISKSEPILEGKSVSYADYAMIFQTLDYDFSNEKSFDYSNLDKPAKLLIYKNLYQLFGRFTHLAKEIREQSLSFSSNILKNLVINLTMTHLKNMPSISEML